MIDRFTELLRELGVEYALSLHPDSHGVCKLCVNEIMHIQIEYRQEREALVIYTFICEIPAGKFRENVLKAALKANHRSPEKPILSYSDKNNQLALFQYIPIEPLTGKKLAEWLESFVKKAEEWRQAVQAGDLASLVPPAQIQSKGMFGLTP